MPRAVVGDQVRPTIAIQVDTARDHHSALADCRAGRASETPLAAATADNINHTALMQLFM